MMSAYFAVGIKSYSKYALILFREGTRTKRKVRQDLKTENSAEGTALLNAGGNRMNIKDLLKDAYKEGMTLEEIETALKDIDLPTDNSAEIDRLKTALSKSNAEAADFKKQLREKMTAEELKAKEDAEKMEDLQSKYDALLRESDISKNKARFLALGYDDALATETAEAMVNGDTEKVFTNHKKHLDSVEKKIREDVLKDTPKPTGGSGKTAMTKEMFSKMSLAEQVKFAQDNPEEYKDLYGGN